MNLLNSHSCLENIDLIEHNNEILEIINLLEGYYDYDCALVCKFQDELNKKLKQQIHACKISELTEFLSTRDIKNGIDIYLENECLIFLLYGQGYELKKGADNLVIEAVKVLPYDNNKNFINIVPLLFGDSPKIMKERDNYGN